MTHHLKTYRLFLAACAGILLLWFVAPERSTVAIDFSLSNVAQFLMLIPPVFVLLGLLEVWLPRETVVKYLGDGAGMRGFVIMLILGSVSAGPLYIAFPLGIMLLQKGVRLAYIIFFLGVWSSAKIPMMVFETAALGVPFTLWHVGISLVLYLGVALLMERFCSAQKILDAAALNAAKKAA